ncbi:MAG: thioredoxin family protein [Flavobacteriales bacterium]|jgi:hypothetical protein|nr:thioredoxin family protein [Flavobacteriales bacterium]MBK6753056.1 thioredoxin family protein [Flavobacteriales bacterium]MBK7085683.1 thioredoxin family protein [Flavobacteriales bacterium]MBK7752740.1 thioredoxin family protein [Flavobacteriales bacterium]MBK9077571.1 thioredoxin family protein [Flavobacteriales bacterium]
MIKIAALSALTLMAFTPHGELKDMNIGDALPMADHPMMDVSGKEFNLKQLAAKNGLLVVFTCNTCPFVVGSEGSEGWEGRYPELGVFARQNGVGLALVNSNEAKRAMGDGLEDMKAHFTEKKYTHYYLLDKGHAVADAFGARTTPHVFLFDKDMKLVYKGAIDDNVESASKVQVPYVRNAITNLAAGKPIDPATTRNIGCSIKRVEHQH